MAYTTGALGVPTNYNFVSSFDMHKPDIDPELTLARGKQTLYGLLRSLGLSKATTGLQYEHFEQDWIMPKIKATTAGGGAGAAVTLTLDASAIDALSLTNSPYISTNTQNLLPVRVNDLLLIKPATGSVNAGTYIRAFVKSINAGAGTFVAQPILSTQSIPAIGTADEIIIYSNSFGEGTGQPEGRATKAIKKTNNLQIFKNTLDITGSEEKMMSWIMVNGKPFWYAVEEENTQKVHDNHKELGLLLGQKFTNTSLVNTSAATETLTGTEGLIPGILSGGNIVNYSGITGITLADMENAVKILDRERGSKKNWLKAGINLSIDIDNKLGDRFKEGGFVYGNTTFDEKKKVALEWDTFSIGNYMFVKETYDAFNDPQTLGAAGYGFPNEAMVIPMDNKVVSVNGEGVTVPSLRVRYLENRENKVVFANMIEIDGVDKMTFRYLSHCGLEMFAKNRYLYIRK